MFGVSCSGKKSLPVLAQQGQGQMKSSRACTLVLVESCGQLLASKGGRAMAI